MKKSLLTSVLTIVLLSFTANAETYDTVRPSIATINCNSDATCSAKGSYRIQSATVNGATASIILSWHTGIGGDTCSTIDNTNGPWYRPTGVVFGCFKSDAFLPPTIGNKIVNGPATSTINNCAKFANTTGTLLADTGAACGSGSGGSGNVTGPTGSYSNTIPSFSGTTGLVLQDSKLTVQNAENARHYPVIGTIYNASTFASTTGFTANGAAVTIVSNALQFASSASSLDIYTVYSLDYSTSPWAHFDLDHWKNCGKIQNGTRTSTSYGLGFGTRSASTIGVGSGGVVGRLDLTNGADKGKLFIYAGASLSQVAVSSAALSMSASDSTVDNIEVCTSVSEDTVTFTAIDNTTMAAPVSVSYVVPYTDTVTDPPGLSSNSTFSVFSFGGTHKVTSLTFSSDTRKNAIVAAVTDSRGFREPGTPDGAWPRILNKTVPTITLGGNGEKMADVIARMPSILATNASNIILEIGLNDLPWNTNLSANSTQYQTIVDALHAGGKIVYHMLPPYAGSTNEPSVAAQTSYLTTTFPGYIIPDRTHNWDDAHRSVILSADGIHSNGYGHQLESEDAADLFKYTTPPAFVDLRNGVNGTLPAVNLPSPGASTLGGVKAATGTTGQYMNGIGTDGAPSFGTPAGGGWTCNPFTPTLTGQGGGTPTYTLQQGTGCRSGNLVWISWKVRITALVGASSYLITAIPFTSGAYQSIPVNGYFNVPLTAGVTALGAEPSSGQTYIAYLEMKSNGAQVFKTASDLSVCSVGSPCTIEGSGSYITTDP